MTDQPEVDQNEIDRKAKRSVVINAVAAVALIGLGVNLFFTDVFRSEPPQNNQSLASGFDPLHCGCSGGNALL